MRRIFYATKGNTMSRTIIYLDVDGVINAIRNGTPSQKRTGFKDFRRVIVRGFQIQYAQELIDQLNALADHEDVTICWLTTWEEQAPKELAPALGINGQNWEVLTGDVHAWQGRNWWKLNAIRDHVGEHQPDLAIWIDDDIKLEREALYWVAETEGVMAISPDALDGLLQSDLDHIHENIEANK